MKKIGTLIVFMALLAFASCSKEAIETDIQQAESQITKGKNNPLTARTNCDILGSSQITPGSTVTYTYSSNFTPNDVNWSVQSGSITIVSGQGTNTVTLSFGSNFTTGSIFAIGSGNGGIVCSDSMTITAGCTPPTEIEIVQVSGACPGQTFTFRADTNGSTTGGSYQWTVFQGASITSGQGTRTITVASPPSGGFSIRVVHTNSCQNTQLTGFNLAEFSASCGGGGGLGGF